MYYWVVAWGRPGTRLDGGKSLFGPYTSMRAQEVADSLMSETEIYSFPTRNTARATQYLKEKGVVANPGNWEEQSKRVRHPKGFE